MKKWIDILIQLLDRTMAYLSKVRKALVAFRDCLPQSKGVEGGEAASA